MNKMNAQYEMYWIGPYSVLQQKIIETALFSISLNLSFESIHKHPFELDFEPENIPAPELVIKTSPDWKA